MDENFNFSVFSSKCNEYVQQHPINLKELCITKSVIKTNDFFKSVEAEEAEMAPALSNKELGTMDEYAELFKVFDTYPTNLQRLPKKRDLQRTNSAILKGNDTILDQTAINSSNVSLAPICNRLDDQPSAAKVYSDYKKFQQKLRQAYNEAASLEKEQTKWLAKIAQLEMFVQQLAKLMPCEREAPDAFTAEEQSKLATIAENMMELNYLRANSLTQLVNPMDTTGRQDTFVDVLNYALMQINSFCTP
ncbi:augmin complex subunit msd5 [Drosophila navojoa]|nr:augmin complex subunit msd5 [Drosophila navojoa]